MCSIRALCLNSKSDPEENKMTAHKRTLYLVTFAILFASAQFALAQEGKKIYAQKLLDETLSKHKDVVIMAMHVTPPGTVERSASWRSASSSPARRV